MEDSVIRIENVSKYYELNKGWIKKKVSYIKAVDDVTLKIEMGKTLGLVGESGSGKTTLARLTLGLIPPTGGTIHIGNQDMARMKGAVSKEIRKQISVIFQDPAASLNPRSTVGRSIMRPLIVQGCSKEDAEKKAIESLSKVNLSDAYFYRYPHQLSGGQQQRVCIARAISLEPQIIILDEPTSALDISVQAQVLNLLLDLQEEYELTYLFITHDLNVVRYMSDDLAVMYLGRIVEKGPTEEVFHHPIHPYTHSLISSVPILNPKERGTDRMKLEGEIGSLIHLPEGCRLSSRCPFRDERCEKEPPELTDFGSGHFAACIKANEIHY